ncbi:hypothetical protein EV702DRAFT_1051191 [Suillus placidus]|uniref:Uncharacterized protein n=1 Tax=Suillus placidus TaxID=48579 RepID=A0A9P6ZGG2_9AGAM|nr:hypothetical protein EV702DRAFT_1051191 [Suillus placidus]
MTMPVGDVRPTHPTESKGVILYFSDIFGFTVLGLDYFFGEPIHECMDKPGFDRPAWIEKAFSNPNTHTRPWTDTVVKKYGSGVKYCAVDFCFGGPHVFNPAKEGCLIARLLTLPLPPRIWRRSTNAPARPFSFFLDLHFDKSDRLVPMLFSCADTDHAFPKETTSEG